MTSKARRTEIAGYPFLNKTMVRLQWQTKQKPRLAWLNMCHLLTDKDLQKLNDHIHKLEKKHGSPDKDRTVTHPADKYLAKQIGFTLCTPHESGVEITPKDCKMFNTIVELLRNECQIYISSINDLTETNWEKIYDQHFDGEYITDGIYWPPHSFEGKFRIYLAKYHKRL